MTTILRPFDASLWQGRCDDETIDGEPADTRRWHQVVSAWPDSPPPSGGSIGAAPGVTLIGFASDAGVRRNHGRPGACDGPPAIRRALANLAWHGNCPVHDAGDVAVDSGGADADGRIDAAHDDLEQGQDALAERISTLLAARQRVVVLGGGHEVALASHDAILRQLARTGSAARVGIVNLDAHFDLRGGARGNSGTPFREIAERCAAQGVPFAYLALGINEDANTAALFARARQLGAQWRLDRAMGAWQLAETRAQLAEFVASVDRVHLSIDLDVLPAATAPGVSAPAARGVDLSIIECLIDELLAVGKVWVTDIAEYNPRHDIDQRTARVAARLVARLCR